MKSIFLSNFLISLFLLFSFAFTLTSFAQEKLPPPNIVWISWEDVSPNLGAYGDEYAHTPYMDQLAQEGLTYLNAYSNYPVCAPARTTIATGQYASSYGGQYMQCRAIPDPAVRLFPHLLRQAGYYTTNGGKNHFQMGFDIDVVWDRYQRGAWNPADSKSLYEGRKPDQPFFTVINFGNTHEGHSRMQNERWVNQVQKAIGKHKHDPEQAPLPPYYPDTEKVRENVALYYDNITYTDSLSGIILKQLEEEGLADNTIVMMWGDHGWGLSRGKRWPYISGLRVPLIVKIPEMYQKAMLSKRDYRPGDKVEELVSFVDFAPTMLSLAGVEVSDFMQGQAFLGQQAQTPREYVYGGRGRMDETYECMRAVLDHDYLYIRNYMWHLPYLQTVRTMERQQIMQEWRRLYNEEKLNDVQKQFFQQPKPVEELYNIKEDPHQINNLATDKKYASILQRFRNENKSWQNKIGDVGLIMEPELDMMKWPEGKWPETAAPTFTTNYRNYWNGEVEVSIDCEMPDATIVWKYVGENDWRLYNQQVVVGPGRILQAKATRLGFYTSPVSEFYLGMDKIQIKDVETYRHWREKVEEQNLVSRLIKIKELDLQAKAALDEYYNYLEDKSGSIRYWATVGIRTLSQNKKEKEKAKATFYQLIKDPSPLVKIEAAYGLCEMDDFEKGIPVLREALEHQQESVRLYAMNHLDKMGEKAKLALPFPKIPLGTANNYSHRIFIRIYKRLGIKPEDLEYATPAQVQDIRGVYNSIVLENLWDYGF